MPSSVFLYGTLRAAPLLRAVAGGESAAPQPATLPGWLLKPVEDQPVPMIVAGEGRVAGELHHLAPAQIDRLDYFERAFGYTPARVTVETAEGRVETRVYLPPSDLSPGAGQWSLAQWRAGHERAGVLAAEELFSLDPLPPAEVLRGLWPMIEHRAWAKTRAEAAAPSRGRVEAEMLAADPPAGRFYRFHGLTLRHRRFDGGLTEPLKREVFHGVDATVVLPYDPVRGKVLLVEQFRVGAFARHDPAALMLEPVAGIIDARETPEETAHREAREEAGVTLTALHPAGQFYPSPGSSTDYFHCFLGLCDIPQTETFGGGLEEEAEDLRLHPMAFDEALALADAGAIRAGPLLYMLMWTARARDRLGLM